MGCDRETIEETGSIYASNLDDCALRALEIIHNDYSLGSLEELKEIAKEAVKDMAPEQKYVRAAYTGGTYLDEGMRTMWEVTGGIYSNAPLYPEYKLESGKEIQAHTAIDYGEEEFTLGRPHPAIDASIRSASARRELTACSIRSAIPGWWWTRPARSACEKVHSWASVAATTS
jgi:hypothetical protein